MASQQPYHNASAAAQVYDHDHANRGVGARPAAASQPPVAAAAPADADGDWEGGEVQPRRCNDALFALLFCAHLGASESRSR